MANWEALLGLPLETALEKVRALGMEPRVLVTRAPRRKGDAAEEPGRNGTLRVIRVCGLEPPAGCELTVSAFEDGDPKKS